MQKLEEKIEYCFKDKSLLETALTHTSYANERKHGTQSYERLEFLGDSILGYVTADYLYRHIPELPEGEMTKLRSELVCEASLHETACSLGISDYMKLGRGEEQTGGRGRVSVLADMVEAIIAAIYIDSGLDEARKFIYRFILIRAETAISVKAENNKSALQEELQKNGDISIIYEEVSESGPDHNKSFCFRVLVNGREMGTGTGRTKKEAEQHAAGAALEALRNNAQ